MGGPTKLNAKNKLRANARTPAAAIQRSRITQGRGCDLSMLCHECTACPYSGPPPLQPIALLAGHTHHPATPKKKTPPTTSMEAEPEPEAENAKKESW